MSIKDMVPSLLKATCSYLGVARQTIDLSSPSSFCDSLRMLWLFYIVRKYTMLSPLRLKALYRLAKSIDQSFVLGDAVECGVCNGGSAAVIAYVVKQSPLNRKIWLFDSFEGLPEPTEKDGAKVQQESYKGLAKGDISNVRKIFQKLAIPDTRVHIVKGWFQDTFPSIEIKRIGLLHIDADWYEPVKLCLEKFYDTVESGGFIVLDDYGCYEGCRRATDEFIKERSLNMKLIQIDYTGHYFQKAR